ncbi:MAG: GntR family transcriptional regulator [Gemmatimonadota bacterium]
MFETLDPRSPTPLYEQIAARVRLAIASGELEPGDALPSVRALARQLRVNPATVVQAYRDLAIDDFVEIRHGQGTFVMEVPNPLREEERREQAALMIRDLLQEGARRGLSLNDLAEAFYAETGAMLSE